MNRSIIGIIIAAIVIGIFVLALTNPNLRENKETWFGFINVNPDQSTPIQEQKESTSSKVICDPSYPDLCIHLILQILIVRRFNSVTLGYYNQMNMGLI